MELNLSDINKSTHVFFCDSYFAADETKLIHFLLPDQKSRASKFICEKSKNIYLLSHAFLNKSLSMLLKKNLNELIFYQNSSGKPYLKNSSCFFNLSHSHKSWAIVLSKYDVGIDIENVKYNLDCESIASSYFHPFEKNYINSSNNKYDAFFYIWTRKEAFFKATGTGINENLSNVNVVAENILSNISLKSEFFLTTKRIDEIYISVAKTNNEPIHFTKIDAKNYFDFFC